MPHSATQRLVVGALAGVVGTYFMAASHPLWNRLMARHLPRDVRRLRNQRAGVGPTHAQPEPRTHTSDLTAGEKAVQVAYRHVVGQPPELETRERLGSVLHYVFGAGAGALYALLADRYPAVTLGHGTAYGSAVWLLADELLVPATGLGKDPRESSLEEHGYVLFAHLAYGLALESARRPLAHIIR